MRGPLLELNIITLLKVLLLFCKYLLEKKIHFNKALENFYKVKLTCKNELKTNNDNS